jgi:hypothetical protein
MARQVFSNQNGHSSEMNGHGNGHSNGHSNGLEEHRVAIPEMCFFCFDVLHKVKWEHIWCLGRPAYILSLHFRNCMDSTDMLKLTSLELRTRLSKKTFSSENNFI